MLFKRLRPWKLTFSDIQAIVFDFDGVFTDNRVMVDENGTEIVRCHRGDGLGIKWLRDRKIPLLILSTETNPVVAMRARKLAVECLYGVVDKKQALIDYCAKMKMDIRKVIYVGNDQNDLEAMKAAGYGIAPKDAHREIRRIAKYILAHKGGAGAVKELAEKLMKS